MAKNKMIINLVGQEVTLKFNMGTLRRMKERTGRDPLRNVEISDMLSIVQLAQDVINPAIMTELGSDGDYFTPDQLDEISFEQAIAVVTSFTKAYTQDEPEVKEDTQRSVGI